MAKFDIVLLTLRRGYCIKQIEKSLHEADNTADFKRQSVIIPNPDNIIFSAVPFLKYYSQ